MAKEYKICVRAFDSKGVVLGNFTNHGAYQDTWFKVTASTKSEALKNGLIDYRKRTDIPKTDYIKVVYCEVAS